MSTPPPIEQLRKLTQIIISPDLHYGNIREACNEMYRLFKELTDFEEDEEANKNNIFLESGMAIGPADAAFCIIDFWRTRNFMAGIRAALSDRIADQPDKPITVLYAGTGPFGTLLIPLCTQFQPTEIQLVLLEINPKSLDHLNRLIHKLGLESYIKHIELADACNWEIPDSLQPDILVSETMKKGLDREPQVELISALLVQCKRKPLLIPQRIVVGAALMGNLQHDSPNLKMLGTLLELNKESALVIKQQRSALLIFDEGLKIIVPEFSSFQETLILHTYICIYKEFELAFGQSSITLPHKLNFDPAHTPCSIHFRYDLGSKPGFRFVYLELA